MRPERGLRRTGQQSGLGLDALDIVAGRQQQLRRALVSDRVAGNERGRQFFGDCRDHDFRVSDPVMELKVTACERFQCPASGTGAPIPAGAEATDRRARRCGFLSTFSAAVRDHARPTAVRSRAPTTRDRSSTDADTWEAMRVSEATPFLRRAPCAALTIDRCLAISLATRELLSPPSRVSLGEWILPLQSKVC